MPANLHLNVENILYNNELPKDFFSSKKLLELDWVLGWLERDQERLLLSNLVKITLHLEFYQWKKWERGKKEMTWNFVLKTYSPLYFYYLKLTPGLEYLIMNLRKEGMYLYKFVKLEGLNKKWSLNKTKLTIFSAWLKESSCQQLSALASVVGNWHLNILSMFSLGLWRGEEKMVGIAFHICRDKPPKFGEFFK